MTAKEYLRQSIRLDKRIAADRREIDRLKELADSIQSSDSTQDRVQSGRVSDSTGETATKIADLKATINDEIGCLIDLKTEIRERINEMPDDDLRLVLQERYLNLLTWKKIAAGMKYSVRNVIYLHGKALIRFNSIYSK
jgi:DNA-directed RNA polymerase specialized sigma subunit